MMKMFSKTSLYSAIIIILMMQVIAIINLPPIGIDSREYLSLGRSLLEGKGYSITNFYEPGSESFNQEIPSRMRQPLYPLFLIPFYWLPGQSILFLQIVQLIINFLTFLLLLKCSKEVFGTKVWTWTPVLIALYYPLWISSAYVLTEVLFTFLISISIYFLIKSVKSNNKILFILTGLSVGATFLTRPIALLVVGVILFSLIMYYGFWSGLKFWGFLLIGFLLVTSPWVIRNAISLREVTPFSSDGGFNIWVGALNLDTLPPHDDPEFQRIVSNSYYHERFANARFTEEGIKIIKSKPLKTFWDGLIRIPKTWYYLPGTKNLINKFYFFIPLSLFQSSLVLLAIYGFIRSTKKIALLLIIPAISISMVFFISLGIARYLIPAMPLVLLLSGQGIQEIILNIKEVHK